MNEKQPKIISPEEMREAKAGYDDRKNSFADVFLRNWEQETAHFSKADLLRTAYVYFATPNSFAVNEHIRKTNERIKNESLHR